MNRSCIQRARGWWPRLSFILLAASSLVVGCKSTPRNAGVHIVHKKKPPAPAQATHSTDPALKNVPLEELVKMPHIQDVTYQRFVRPLLRKLGCDGPACHGTHRGGGLYFTGGTGHNRKDYEAILLRLDRKHPEQSILVQKILNLDPHNGGRNIDPKSCDYARLIAWIGQQPEPDCTNPPPTEKSVRFAREVVPALQALGCAEKTCHGGGLAPTRFDLKGLVSAPVQTEKALSEFARLDPGVLATWLHPIVLAANGEDKIHQPKADPLSCAYRRLYGFLAQSPELACELVPKTPLKLPSLEKFTQYVLPAMGRRGCLQPACHGGGAGDMYLVPGLLDSPMARHSYLLLLPRIEDLSHVETSTLLRTARNQEPHGGGKRLGGKGDCVDEQMLAWLQSRPIKDCPPPVPPSFELFVARVQPVLDRMTCTNPKCHGGLVPDFILAKAPSQLSKLMTNYKAILKQIDYDYMPLSGIMLRMREPCAYDITGAWIEKRPLPNCTLQDPNPDIFPRRDDQGNIVHPKAEPGPPPPAKP